MHTEFSVDDEDSMNEMRELRRRINLHELQDPREMEKENDIEPDVCTLYVT